MSLPWDGTYLGYITKSQILDKYKYEGYIYWKLQLNIIPNESGESQITVFCGARGSQNTYPCIIDQLKELFGLRKMGTHWLRLGKRIIIVTKVESNSDFEILTYLKLSRFEKNIYPKFQEEVRRIFAFKEILGVKFATLNNLTVIPKISNSGDDLSLDDFTVVSSRDPGFDFDKGIIKKPMLKLWFGGKNEELMKEIKELLGIDDINYNNRVTDIRLKINDVIMKVDKEQVLLAVDLMKRIDSYC